MCHIVPVEQYSALHRASGTVYSFTPFLWNSIQFYTLSVYSFIPFQLNSIVLHRFSITAYNFTPFQRNSIQFFIVFDDNKCQLVYMCNMFFREISLLNL